ncbi:MAG: hypothetical protein ABSA75_12645 [Candidatus Bathyarchaeia archaeon]|jgi:hypothetical protein
MSKTKLQKKQTGQLIIRGITQENATKLIEFLAQGTLQSQDRLFESADFWPQNEMDDYADAVIAAMLIAKNTALTEDRKTRRRSQNVIHYE